jgi:fermentation-respiration switch protein FrsA (DUF1100 family)
MKSHRLFLCFVIMMLISLMNFICYAQTADSKKVVGKWNGVIDAMGTKIHVMVSIEENNGKLTGKADSPDQNAFGIPIETIKITGNNIEMVLESVGGNYKGTFDNSADSIKGEWTQGGNTTPLVMTKEVASEKKVLSEEKTYTSYWEGKLAFGSTTLPVIFKLYKNKDGSTSGHMDSPNQNVKNMEAKKVEFAGDSMHFKVESIGGSYACLMEKDSAVIKGKWTQGGMSFPLDLKKIDKLVAPNRPQTPQKPYPYNDEDITFENKTAGITLAGSFTFPKGEGKYPAVVMVTGSGPQDRDESIFDHKIFLVIADYLTRNGIAVLRFDDRGVAKSKGNFSSATSIDFASDALAGVQYLKSRKEVIANKVGVVGHSEGGLIAPMIASQSNEVNYIVMLAGPGLRGDKVIIKQIGLIMKANGKTDTETKKEVDERERYINTVVNEPDSAKAYDQMKKIFDDKINTLSDADKKKPENSDKIFEAQAKAMLSPWFRFFLKYDPAPALENVTIPVLALNGEKDIQVEPKENLATIESALKTAGNTNYKIVELPGLNHAFQHCKTCAETEYGQLEETFAPEALKIIGDWILQVTK